MKMRKDMSLKELSFALTQHEDDLQLFANGISMDAYAEFEQTEDAIMELLYLLYQKYEQKGIKPDADTTKYIESLKKKIEEIRANVFDEEEDELEDYSKSTAKNEGKFLHTFFLSLTGTSLYLDADTYGDIAKYGVYNGGTVHQIFERIAGTDTSRIFDAMVTSLRTGKTLSEARELVKRELKKTKNFVKNEIDSIINGIANDVTLAFSAQHKTRLLYSTALDNKVCEECSQYEGAVFMYDSPEIPSPPQHIHCRCKLIPIPNDGEDYSDLLMDFGDYFEELSPEAQQERLGKDKYGLLRSGGYKLMSYEEPLPNQRMTLPQLKERDISLFRA